jgi:hypothetical protein
MTKELEELLARARTVSMTPNEMEEQRKSFAYGSAKIENDDITKQHIDEAARRIRQPPSNG